MGSGQDDDRDTGEGTLSLVLKLVENGQDGAKERLFRLVYEELRVMARGRLGSDPARHSMDTNSMVHEAYLKLVGSDGASWENRRHFFGAAVRAMRQILVERARKRNAAKRGPQFKKVTLNEEIAIAEDSVDMLALDDALARLGKYDKRKMRVVEYRHFLGLSAAETAELLNVSPRTVDTDWNFARAWLKRELGS